MSRYKYGIMIDNDIEPTRFTSVRAAVDAWLDLQVPHGYICRMITISGREVIMGFKSVGRIPFDKGTYGISRRWVTEI